MSTQNSEKAITEADVLITAALADRPARQPDFAAQNQALHTLAQQLTDDPPSMLKTLVRIAQDLCGADTVGVSLLETSSDGTSVFRWVAIAGALESLEQTTTPGNFSPCGTTIDCGTPQLYARPELYFTYLHHPQFPIFEGLLFPICAGDRQLGTIWIISHNDQHQFDREDLRLMTSLTGFTATALQSIHLRQTAELALGREQAARLETEATRQALDEAAQRAVDILESITDAFISLDREWRITYVNQAVLRINNLQRSEMIGKTHWEIWPWSVGTIVEQTYRLVVADQVVAHFEVLYEPLMMWLEIHAYPAGEGLSLYFRDITDRKQAESALRRSEERYRTLFELIDEGFAVIEMLFDENDKAIDYRFLEVNLAFENQTGLQQATGKTARQLVPNLEDHWVEIYGKIALTGESLRFENGSEAMNRWFDVYAFTIGQPHERKVALLFKDISDRKRIESERERILQREQAAREVAENANRIKDEFLAVLSHELRSPLNPILGWSQLLRRGKLDKVKTAQALETIERNAQLQLQLIEDLLDISRIMRGKLTLVAVPVNLSFVISAALETVRLAAEAKSIHIEVNLQPNIRQVYGDAGRLQQVVWNLLSNAVKFTPIGGRVKVRLTQTNQDVQLQVMDTGKGINLEFLPYVFEHFRQEDGATTRKFGGLGLGLAIARQIAELHGGRIWAESRGENQGATFTVELPVLPTANLLEEVTDTTEAPSDDLVLANLHVLIVDDEPDSRDFVAFVLKQAGAKVTAVGSASEALQLLSTTPFDILLSDIGMPEMDGYALIREIRKSRDDRGRNLPAIALTAYAGEYQQREAIASGFQSHVTKPVDPEKIVTVVARMCGRKREVKA